jgi:farnesyl-diphosphate farnesyltransferase
MERTAGVKDAGARRRSLIFLQRVLKFKNSSTGAAPSPMGLLRDVSRSFYLTLRVLPSAIRGRIGLAYLLARTTDTIADTQLVSLEDRVHALRRLRERILGLASGPLDFFQLAQCQASAAERALLQCSEASVALLESLDAEDVRLIRGVIETICGGQEFDLLRFAGASVNRIVALRTDEELEDYTFRVAGCVGEFWTRTCHRHLFPKAPVDEQLLLANGVKFGKGLQLVNILRDLPADLRNGRCYLPRAALEVCSLSPEDLLEAGNEPRLRPAYNRLLDRAQSYLHAGWAYTNALPWMQFRVRLACAWPILIGLETLRLLRGSNVLDATRRLKVSRRQVRRILSHSVLCCWRPRSWRSLVPGV